MYNEELKSKFIRDYTMSIKTAQLCRLIFDSIAKYEQQWDADICTKSENELHPVIDSISGMRNKTTERHLLVLRDYAKWCIAMKVEDACDSILHIKTTGVEKIRQQTVASPQHLQDYLNNICDPESAETTDNIYRCYYWLAYIGLKEEDIFRVKCSDVDFLDMLVRCGEEDYPFYRESIQALRNCATLTKFVYKNPKFWPERIEYHDRAEGDTLVRGIRSTPTIRYFRVELSRRSKAKNDEGKTDLKLSYYRVWLSGVFYRIYEIERRGVSIDFNDIIFEFLNKTEDLSDSRRRQIVKEYMEDYIRWKLAYSF